MEKLIADFPDGTAEILDRIAAKNNRTRAGEMREAIQNHVSRYYRTVPASKPEVKELTAHRKACKDGKRLPGAKR